MATNRIAYLDLVKLFTIYLVILGHVIFMMVGGLVVGEKAYSFIYSFHMPLFMLLSGYFFSPKLLDKSFSALLTSKARQLLLPAVTCTVLCCLYLFFFRPWFNFRDEIIGNSWFLKTLFIYYVLFYWLKRLSLPSWVLFSASCAVLFFIPRGATLQINLLWPYFLGGYLLKEHGVFEKTKHLSSLTIIFVSLFVISYALQRHFKIPNYIPVNIETIFNSGHLLLLRYIVAFSGSLSVIFLFKVGEKQFLGENSVVNKVAHYGKYTLGVYVLQTLLVANIFPDTLAFRVESEFLLNVVVAPLISLAFLAVCLLLIHLFSRNRILDLLLFGGQYHKR
ncbi:MAG: acyltransferase family protein [Bacteroidales bacterium]|nr:acyltransferase family protein [Bacteroidales bacterium]